MSQKSLSQRLFEATDLILNCKDDVGLMKQAVDEMHAIYGLISTISPFDQNDEEILLPTGKAISPGNAAHCLLEMKRTTVFIRGINKAIKAVRSKTNKVIQILYAGTGPYATLITPLLSIYTKNEVQIDLLDINKKSLDSALAIIHELGYSGCINAVMCEDATTIKTKIKYDIIISETMQAALRSEPQVSVM